MTLAVYTELEIQALFITGYRGYEEMFLNSEI